MNQTKNENGVKAAWYRIAAAYNHAFRTRVVHTMVHGTLVLLLLDGHHPIMAMGIIAAWVLCYPWKKERDEWREMKARREETA